MSLQSSSLPARAAFPVNLRDLGTGLAVLGGLALWLAALPALLARDDFAHHDATCLSYRDPVTGRSVALRAHNSGSASGDCRADALDTRP